MCVYLCLHFHIVCNNITACIVRWCGQAPLFFYERERGGDALRQREREGEGAGVLIKTDCLLTKFSKKRTGNHYFTAKWLVH